MRGPGLKVALDVRRTWRCPACGYERRVDGRQTTVRCGCGEGRFMKLVAAPRVERPTNRPVNVYVDAEALLASLGEPPSAAAAPPSEAPAGTETAITSPVSDPGVAVAVIGAKATTDDTPAAVTAAPLADVSAARDADIGHEAPLVVGDSTKSEAPAPAGAAQSDRSGAPNSGRPRDRHKRRSSRGPHRDGSGGDRPSGQDPAK